MNPGDLDFCIEGKFLNIKGKREVKQGCTTSQRVLNQKFDLQETVENDKIIVNKC